MQHLFRPSSGGLDDLATDGMHLIDDICQIYDNYVDFETEVLVASIRSPMHIVNAAKIGAHVVTVAAGGLCGRCSTIP